MALALFFIISAVSSKTAGNCTYEVGVINEAPPHSISDEEYLYQAITNTYADQSVVQLLGRKDKRTPAFIEMLMKLSERHLDLIVEIGTLRHSRDSCSSDGCSTLVFSNFAGLTNMKVISVDNDENSINKARGAVQFKNSVEFVKADSVEFLQKYDRGLIDLLYLDSTDVNVNKPNISMKLHLEEIKAAYDKLHKKSIVAIDDCGSNSSPNCKQVREFLVNEGWKVIMSGQVEIYSFS